MTDIVERLRTQSDRVTDIGIVYGVEDDETCAACNGTGLLDVDLTPRQLRLARKFGYEAETITVTCPECCLGGPR